MLADRKWVERNLGFDPITTPPPPETFVVKRVKDAAAKKTAKVTAEDFRREIIDFDSESAEGRAFMAFSTSTGAVALHRHSLAKGTRAADRAEAERQWQGTAAARRRAGRDLDRRRGPRAQPRADAGQGFTQRLRALYA
ncbi:hypothetical protein BRDID11002_63800 [Bradyrhizobium diazoefficiens]